MGPGPIRSIAAGRRPILRRVFAVLRPSRRAHQQDADLASPSRDERSGPDTGWRAPIEIGGEIVGGIGVGGAPAHTLTTPALKLGWMRLALRRKFQHPSDWGISGKVFGWPVPGAGGLQQRCAGAGFCRVPGRSGTLDDHQNRHNPFLSRHDLRLKFVRPEAAPSRSTSFPIRAMRVGGISIKLEWACSTWWANRCPRDRCAPLYDHTLRISHPRSLRDVPRQLR